MEKTLTITVTLVVYQVLLVAIGLWASRRNRDKADFFLGGRGLGPVVAAISYCSSASSAWTLLGVSGAAYVLGLSVIWVAAGSISGMLVAWGWVGRRLMRSSRARDQITVTDVLAGDSGGRLRKGIVWSSSCIIIFSYTFYVAAQFQGAGNTFSAGFGMSMTSSILVGAAIIMTYTLLGGFWAVSVTDTLQGLLMAIAALALPITAVAKVGGASGFLEGLASVSKPEQLSLTGGHVGLVAVGVVLGSLSIGLGTFGQPHLLVRFMALRDEASLRTARALTIVWYLVVFTGMVFLGLAGRILFPAAGNAETIFFQLADTLFPAVFSGVLIAAVLSAIMSTADSQLLVAASAIVHDLGFGRAGTSSGLILSRISIVLLVGLAVLVALWLPERIFSRVLFAWSAMGAAFGPTLLLRLAGCQLRPGAVLASMATGFVLAVVFYSLPDSPGDILERLLPFMVSIGLLAVTGQWRPGLAPRTR